MPETASPNRFDSHHDEASGISAEMSGNRTDYKEKRVGQVESSHFKATAHKMRLTPWGCQLNVGLNSEESTPRETNAPHGIVRASHVGILNGFS
jgi:hypothetical protein